MCSATKQRNLLYISYSFSLFSFLYIHKARRGILELIDDVLLLLIKRVAIKLLFHKSVFYSFFWLIGKRDLSNFYETVYFQTHKPGDGTYCNAT